MAYSKVEILLLFFPFKRIISVTKVCVMVVISPKIVFKLIRRFVTNIDRIISYLSYLNFLRPLAVKQEF